MPEYRQTIILSNVNSLLGALFIASFALGAGLMIWHAAFDTNPLQEVMIQALTQLNTT